MATQTMSSRRRKGDIQCGGEAKRPRLEAVMNKQSDELLPPTVPPSVFPLIWNFLLTPSEVIDPTSTTGCIDFKSIASFMLVSKGTKAAFDGCNGWSLCLKAVEKEESAKKQVRDGYVDRALPLTEKSEDELSNEEIQQFRQAADEGNRVQPLVHRLRHVQIEMLPIATRLAGIYCGERVPDQEYFETRRASLEEQSDQIRQIVEVLELKIEAELKRIEVARLRMLLRRPRLG